MENEDLRDRLSLLGDKKLGGLNIDYKPYIPAGSVEQLCDGIDTVDQLK